MEILFIILLLLVVGALNIACFFVGANVRQKVDKGETLELPKVDLTKPIREREARKEAEADREYYDTIMSNIDNYDGSGLGQKDVPRR